ncbi:MAG: hypothetical protein R3298_01810 [Gammaproteobacteria bacterium]|nr:hypothetical protein [Gammaproteobacteria bacterium]
MRKTVLCLMLALSPFLFGQARAGIYSDDLSRCLVESSTQDDKIVLVKWMFTAMALHPDVASMASVTDAQRDVANAAAAAMFVRLMTETCREPARKAIRYEGALAVQQGFTVFGQVAGQELFANPAVARNLAGLDRHIDYDRLNRGLGLE